MILKLTNVDMTNKLIHHDILHEYTSKVMKYYESMSRIHQCFKCQKYDHKTYECRNKQTCEYCAKKHRIEHCDVKKQTNRHHCETCQENHVEWHIECSTRKKDWTRTKKTLRNKFVLHVASTTTSIASVFIFFVSTIFTAMTIEQKKRKIVTSTSQRDRSTSETKQQKQNEINSQTATMKRMLRKKKILAKLTVSHFSSQETLMKREKDVVAKKSNDQKMREITNTQKISQATSTRRVETKKQLWVNERSCEYYNTTSTNLERMLWSHYYKRKI